MNITYAPMTMDDYAVVLDLWQRTEGVGTTDSDSPEGTAQYLARNPDMSLVARDGERCVGAVLCGHDGRRGYLHHLAVDAAYRELGIGRTLVEMCMERLRAAGIEKCNIWVYTHNGGGRAFWAHNGWHERDDLVVIQRATAAPGEDDGLCHVDEAAAGTSR